ncbi:hypothetical protein [Dongia deserti]|nr:hypothetical protein [Dongia deserti]
MHERRGAEQRQCAIFVAGYHVIDATLRARSFPTGNALGVTNTALSF